MSNVVSICIDNRYVNAVRDSYNYISSLLIVITILFALGNIFNIEIFRLPLNIMYSYASIIIICGLVLLLNESTTKYIQLILSLVCFGILISNSVIAIENYLSLQGFLVAFITVIIIDYYLLSMEKINLSNVNIAPSVMKVIYDIFVCVIPIVCSGIIQWLNYNMYHQSIFDGILYFTYKVVAIFNSPITILLIIGLISACWLLGMNGASSINGLFRPFLMLLAMSNLMTGSDYIVTEQFFDMIWMGGSGSLLSCYFALLVSNSIESKQIADNSKSVIFFNINEPILYSVPVIGNKNMMLPFVIVPFVFAYIQYSAMANGVVPPPNGVIIPWITPPVLSGIIITGSIRGGVLQILNLLIGTLIYLPFVYRNFEKN